MIDKHTLLSAGTDQIDHCTLSHATSIARDEEKRCHDPLTHDRDQLYPMIRVSVLPLPLQ